MMQQFASKEAMLKAMENISPFSDQILSKNLKQTTTKTKAKTARSTKKTENDSEQKYKPKYFNCNTWDT
jgi:phosphopantetheinyl transferase (holo-ACP synthase)